MVCDFPLDPPESDEVWVQFPDKETVELIIRRLEKDAYKLYATSVGLKEFEEARSIAADLVEALKILKTSIGQKS